MTTISVALRDLLDREIPLQKAIDQHFATNYRQRTNGVWDSREGFIAHIAHLRTFIARADVTVLEEVDSGPIYAERHIVHLLKDDGGTVDQEVYVFGERDERGRFTRVEEVTLMLVGVEADRDVGSAKAS